MTTADLQPGDPAAHVGLVRVSIGGGTRRADLALPAALPVAELLPELARSLSMLDAHTVHGGYTLTRSDGTPLNPDTGLAFQGVRDGDLLSLLAGTDQEDPKVYDDIVEAMADVIEGQMEPWKPAAGRRTALAAASLLLLLGAAALAIQRTSVPVAVTAGAIALVLLAASLVLARVQSEDEAAIVLAWGGVVYAAVAGFAGTDSDVLIELPVAAAGLGAAAAGMLGLLAVVRHRALLIPAVSVGAVVATASGILTRSDFAPASVYTVTLALATLAGSQLPLMVLNAMGTKVDEPQETADLVADPTEIRPEQLRAEARLGHEVLLAVTSTLGLLVVILSPFAVSLGVTGALTALGACAVIMLRTRQYRVGTEVAVALGFGVAGLVSIAVSILVLHDSWRPALALALAVTAGVLLVATLVPSAPSVRRGRLGDVVETAVIVAMIPLLAFAIGLVQAVRS